MPGLSNRAHRLSPQQRRVWLHQSRLGTQFQVQCAVLFEGRINGEVLRGSLLRMIERHEVLRTTFSLQKGERFPVQVVREQGLLSLLEVDSSECDLETTLEQALRDERRNAFDLENGPLARFILHRMADNRHILIITLPSLCADEASLRNIVEEVTRNYRGLLYGEEIYEQAAPYVQFSDWQNSLLEDDDESGGKRFWMAMDPTGSGTLTLPVETPGHGPFEPERLRIDLKTEIDEQIRSTTTGRGFPSDVFLLTCWEVLLCRLSGERGIVVNTLSDGRIYEEMESALGLYAKWLPVRHTFSEPTGFSDALKDIERYFSKASAWQEYFLPEHSRSDGQDADAVERHRQPIAFAYEQWPEPHWVGSLKLSLVSVFACTDPFKLKLVCQSVGDQHWLELHYDHWVYPPEAVERMSRQFVMVVKQALCAPDALIDDLKITVG